MSNIKYLAINTCNSLEILLNADKRYYFCADDKTLASTTLLPRIDLMLTQANLSIKDLDFLACVVGPGSFTGIRIGVTTIKSLCFALNKSALGVTYFDYMAYNNTLPLTAIVDGLGGVCYLKNLSDDSDQQPICIKNSDIVNYAKGDIITGSLFAPELKNPKIFTPSADLLAGTIQKAFTKRGVCAYNDITPLYLRRSQAEREEGEV